MTKSTMLQELVRAAGKRRLAHRGVGVRRHRDHRTPDRVHQGLDGVGAARIGQVKIGNDEIDFVAREQRERVGKRRRGVEIQLREREAPQVGADDLDADRIVFEQ